MRTLLAVLLFCVAARGEDSRSDRVVLLPIDDRPAVAQFARMIGAVADFEVVMPPAELLGRFTTPGNTRKLEQWLRSYRYGGAQALVLSSDMLAYGGLVASRTHKATAGEALERIDFLRWFRHRNPTIRVYVFSVIMRVAPTADAKSRSWSEQLARWAELSGSTGEQDAAEAESLRKQIPPQALSDYLAARRRNLKINRAMANLLKDGIIDELFYLQDDARERGLHRKDQAALAAHLKRLGLEARVPVYNGADEGSLSLVSRAILRHRSQTIRVFPRYSSGRARTRVQPYEDRPLSYTVAHQIEAAGSELAGSPAAADYKLYINAPDTSEREFEEFLAELVADLKAGRNTALADLLFPAPHRSGADERIVARLEREGLVDRLTGYAAWNTAGNTLGTAIPHANMRVLARKHSDLPADSRARCEVAHLEFLLHRFAGDYIYHDIVRARINDQLRNTEKIATDEFTPETYARINRQVEGELAPLIREFFRRHFEGRSYPVGAAPAGIAVKIQGLEGLSVRLPWPRTFEVAVEYRFSTLVAALRGTERHDPPEGRE